MQIHVRADRYQQYRDGAVKVKNRKCYVCKKWFKYESFGYAEGDNPDNNSCRDCMFWLEHFWNRNRSDVVRINGNHYYVGEPNAKYKGMGGTQVRIKFNDGREVVTDNLWHQGTIPQLWVEAGLEDNASFGELVKEKNNGN